MKMICSRRLFNLACLLAMGSLIVDGMPGPSKDQNGTESLNLGADYEKDTGNITIGQQKPILEDKKDETKIDDVKAKPVMLVQDDTKDKNISDESFKTVFVDGKLQRSNLTLKENYSSEKLKVKPSVQDSQESFVLGDQPNNDSVKDSDLYANNNNTSNQNSHNQPTIGLTITQKDEDSKKSKDFPSTTKSEVKGTTIKPNIADEVHQRNENKLDTALEEIQGMTSSKPVSNKNGQEVEVTLSTPSLSNNDSEGNNKTMAFKPTPNNGTTTLISVKNNNEVDNKTAAPRSTNNDNEVSIKTSAPKSTENDALGSSAATIIPTHNDDKLDSPEETTPSSNSDSDVNSEAMTLHPEDNYTKKYDQEDDENLNGEVDESEDSTSRDESDDTSSTSTDDSDDTLSNSPDDSDDTLSTSLD